MSTLFSFLLLLFTTYASCLLMWYTCYVHELYISLCLLFCIITIRVGDCSCKTLVINRDFWYAHSSKRWREWQSGIGLNVKTCYMCLLLSCALIISLSFCYPHSLNLDFPYIGLSLLTIFTLCLILAFPQAVLSDAQDAQRNLSRNSKCCVFPRPLGMMLLNNKQMYWVSWHASLVRLSWMSLFCVCVLCSWEQSMWCFLHPV